MVADEYTLSDAEERKFKKAWLCAAFVAMGDLTPFADADLQQIPLLVRKNPLRFERDET